MDKDYYKILDIAGTANDQEIRKAYRQLAMKYHPDKNDGNPLLENQFREVQEAYEVLSDPGKRSAYNQQRWYRFSSTKQADEAVTTPYVILHQCLSLNRYIATLDSFHINRQALNNYILKLLSNHNREVLSSDGDGTYKEPVINQLLQAARLLPLKPFQKICDLLLTIAGTDMPAVETINKSLKSKKISHYLDIYLPLLVFAIAIVICILIFLVSNTAV